MQTAAEFYVHVLIDFEKLSEAISEGQQEPLQNLRFAFLHYFLLADLLLLGLVVCFTFLTIQVVPQVIMPIFQVVCRVTSFSLL